MMKATREEAKFQPITLVIETQEELEALKNLTLVPHTVATAIRINCSEGRARYIEQTLRYMHSALLDYQ